MNSLRCFVAMAFDHTDTDHVYEHLIKAALRENRATPIRVDRIEHNDDIDNRIISELEICDFAIADLTYARPSVYFEAGFAQRQVPVIYTCRRDHFKPREDDAAGNYRVHFDLQMKNIIAWNDPADLVFGKRLSKRISLVIKPVLRSKAVQQQEQKAAESFGALSLKGKTRHVLETLTSRLGLHGFRGMRNEELAWRFPYESTSERMLFDPTRKSREMLSKLFTLSQAWLGTKTQKSTIIAATVLITPTITKQFLDSLQVGIISRPIYNLFPNSLEGNPKRLIEHLFICTFRKCPETNMMTALPNFERKIGLNTYSWIGTAMIPVDRKLGNAPTFVRDSWDEDGFIVLERGQATMYRLNAKYIEGRRGRRVGRVKQIPRIIHIHVFDSIRSEVQFRELTKSTMREVESWLIE